ncbi:ATP-binding protein [Halobacteriovorax sp. JY17]|uniref:ATP-binding protein n=1 Tax=Halobacteriovorax sp. JY17 TaxID=2014617 RepID=UPI000C4B864D|nr:ATP-binding protein [Halobacteriovorax sp. JY17]PIK15024.1 MAG: hypothetical protein CES88_11870 [Halobacteriovorax sp. JY17]
MKINLFNYGHLQHRNELKFQLLIHLRWILLSLLTILLCVLMLLYKIDRLVFFYLCFIFLGMGIFNSYSLGRLNSSKEISNWDIFFNILFDLFVISICLHLCGGIHNPFSAFILIYLILGGFLLDARESFLILIASLLSIFFLWLSPLPSLIGQEFNYNTSSYLIGSSVVISFLWALISWVQSSFKVMDRNMIRVTRQLQQADRLKALGLLSAGLSHELATPLNTILLKADRIKRKSGDEFRDDILALSEATNSCINSLRRIQQTSVSNEELDFEEIDLISSVENIIHFKNWNISILKEVESFKYSLPLIGFSQIMVDLIENAIEASGEENVSVLFTHSKEALQIKIINRFSKIDEVILKHFGEPFVTTKKQGTGLGLYNAKLFLESVGAKISLKNIEEDVCVELEIERGVVL